MQIKLRTETDWERWRADTIYTKEPETIAWISDFKPYTTFWDIGANIGIYSIFCAVYNPTCYVHAFEPLRQNYHRLWDNIWENDLTNVKADWLLIDKYDGLCWFEVKNDTVGSSGGQASAKKGKNSTIGYEMPITTGDWLADTYNYPDYIKIDTDGNEFDILSGMKVLLSQKHLKGLLIEINSRKSEINDILLQNGMVPDDKYNNLIDRESDNNVIYRRK